MYGSHGNYLTWFKSEGQICDPRKQDFFFTKMVNCYPTNFIKNISQDPKYAIESYMGITLVISSNL